MAHKEFFKFLTLDGCLVLIMGYKGLRDHVLSLISLMRKVFTNYSVSLSTLQNVLNVDEGQ